MQYLTKHLREAIELNEARLPLYANLTSNKSLSYSKKLINYEKSILLTSWIIDKIGNSYQAKGIPFLKFEFVDIDLASPFSDSFPDHINHKVEIQIFDKSEMFKELSRAIKMKKPNQIVNACNHILERLQTQIHYYNMIRHIVESIRRISYLIPLHEEACKEINIKPPNFYSYLLIKSHQILISPAKTFDEDVAFIQQAGVPFLWQDLPEIGLDNFEYK